MENYKKGNTLIILLIIVVIVIAGGIYFYKQKSGNVVKNPNFESAELCNPGNIEKQTQNIKDACYKEMAIEAVNPALCEKVQGSNFKNQCYYLVSIGAKDKTICAKIADKDLKNQCNLK
jgi:hypothetical protein